MHRGTPRSAGVVQKGALLSGDPFFFAGRRAGGAELSGGAYVDKQGCTKYSRGNT